MNRETSMYSSDTLVVVDRSRQRRRLVIIAAIAAIALLVIALVVIFGATADERQGRARLPPVASPRVRSRR